MDYLRNLLNLPSLQPLTCIRMAKTDLDAGNLLSAILRLRSDADKFTGTSEERALYEMVVRPKIYLDDERKTPDGWIRAYWPDEVCQMLKTFRVEEVSLDHDLGDDQRGTGYDVLLWIEEQVATKRLIPPKLRVHSANSSARQKMESAIAQISRLANRQA